MWFWTIKLYCLKCVSLVLYLNLMLLLSAVGLLTLSLKVSSLLPSSSSVSPKIPLMQVEEEQIADFISKLKGLLVLPKYC